jgi:phosphoglycerate dehydrogenase-like enzyme
MWWPVVATKASSERVTAIGEATAKLAYAMGMRVIATRREVNKPRGDFVEAVFPPHQTAEVMASADYIVCCTPLTNETRGMIGPKGCCL